MKNQMQAIKESERIQSIDILRGFAILGIFFVNMPAFFSPVHYLDPSIYWEKTSDRVLNGLVDFFAQASFYPLFAFLFGYGAVILANRLQIKELSFPKYFSRRLAVLLVFGCLHAFLVWHGDILITYSLCGFLFLLFHKLTGKTLLIVGSLLYVIPFTLFSLGFAAIEMLDPSSLITDLYNQAAVENALYVYGQGTFGEIFSLRFHDWYAVNGPAGFWILALNIVPLMLLGAGFAKKKWLEDVGNHRKLLFSLLVASGIIGGALKSLPFYYKELPYTSMFIQDFFGGPLLALFYIAAIVLMVENSAIHRLLRPFSYVGRLSISNYLLQSVVCTAIFYSYGLGLYGHISFTAGFCLVILLYSLQVWASKRWLAIYQMGPVEYIWRWGTYGQRPSMKRNRERESGK